MSDKRCAISLTAFGIEPTFGGSNARFPSVFPELSPLNPPIPEEKALNAPGMSIANFANAIGDS